MKGKRTGMGDPAHYRSCGCALVDVPRHSSHHLAKVYLASEERIARRMEEWTGVAPPNEHLLGQAEDTQWRLGGMLLAALAMERSIEDGR